jgi:hypothetical protein
MDKPIVYCGSHVFGFDGDTLDSQKNSFLEMLIKMNEGSAGFNKKELDNFIPNPLFDRETLESNVGAFKQSIESLREIRNGAKKATYFTYGSSKVEILSEKSEKSERRVILFRIYAPYNSDIGRLLEKEVGIFDRRFRINYGNFHSVIFEDESKFD